MKYPLLVTAIAAVLLFGCSKAPLTKPSSENDSDQVISIGFYVRGGKQLTRMNDRDFVMVAGPEQRIKATGRVPAPLERGDYFVGYSEAPGAIFSGRIQLIRYERRDDQFVFAGYVPNDSISIEPAPPKNGTAVTRYRLSPSLPAGIYGFGGGLGSFGYWLFQLK